MSITDISAVYVGQGPTKTGQVLVDASSGGTEAKTLPFNATVILDGSSTTFHLLYIDGTQTIPSPSGIILSACGGTAAGTLDVVSAVTHNSVTGQDDYMVVTISGAGTNLQTLKMSGFIFF